MVVRAEIIKKRQSKVLEMIKVFDEICRKHEIWYTLTSGSVLGAIRHSGFIPWDTDMDVFVKIGDMEKLRAALLNDLPKEMKLHIRGREPGYHPSFDRLSLKGVPHEFVHLDIFPLIGAPANEKERLRFTKTCFYTYKILRWKHINTKLFRRRKSVVMRFLKYMVIALIKAVMSLVPDSFICRQYARLENKYSFDTAEYVYTIGSGYGFKECLPKSVIVDSILVPFEDTMLPVPRQYHAYLTNVYGDYMVPRRDNYKGFS